MATKPETKLALESIGMEFMPAEEGLSTLIDEIESESSDCEVLITDDRYHRAFYPAESLQQEATVYGAGRKLALIDISSARTQVSDTTLRTEASSTLLPTKDPFLIEHRLNDFPLLPVVVDIELCAEAALLHQSHVSGRFDTLPSSANRESILFTEFHVAAPLKFFCDAPHNVNVVAESDRSSETFNVQVTADVLNRSGVTIAKNKLLCNSKICITSRSLSPLKSRESFRASVWQRPAYPVPTDTFYSGPSFRLISRFAIAARSIEAELTAPSLIELAGVHRQATGWVFPSALLDATLYACGILSWQEVRAAVCLPTSFGKLQLSQLPRPGQKLRAFATLKQESDHAVYFDFDVTGDDGRMYLAARDYQATFLH